MDFSDVNKVASRKRVCADVDKLREKVSRENKKIIKLKVAQDTAYWDVKEQLRQVETNHEKLQQNMVDVQMQYEAISGQYQDELRLRPETLNKLSSTREICDVLEDYSERLRDTLSRCKADQAALYDAYQRSGQVVRDIKSHQTQAEDKSRQVIENLQDKIKMSSEHHTQLLQYFTAEKQRADSELAEARSGLAATAARRDELLAAGRDLGAKLAQCERDCEKKQETVVSLQRDIKQLIQEFNSHGSEMQNTILKQDKELKESTASNESLKQALTNQEAFTKSVVEQNNQLQEKVAALEEQQATATCVLQDLEEKVESATATNDALKIEVAKQIELKEVLEEEIKTKNEHLANAETEIQNLKEQIATLEAKKTSLISELDKAGEKTNTMHSKVQELTAAGEDMEKKISGIEVALKECREAAEQKIKELSDTITAKDKELDSKTCSISQLICEVKSGADARCKLDLIVQKARSELESERDAAGERERKLLKQVENKDDELSKQMNIILELRSDKERLHNNIQRMQMKIDNIQKELTGPPAGRPSRVEPEQDDNAVMLTPCAQKKDAVNHKRGEFAVPRSEPEQLDSMLFNFLSDSSMDGDNTLDPFEVNRRFEAISRGERVSPTPLGALKRRRGAVPATQGGLRHKNAPKENIISLSQVKDDMKNKERTFFKNRRNDGKLKKMKEPLISKQ